MVHSESETTGGAVSEDVPFKSQFKDSDMLVGSKSRSHPPLGPDSSGTRPL